MTRTELVAKLEKQASQAMKDFKKWSKLNHSENARAAAVEYRERKAFIAELMKLRSLN